MSLEGQQIGRYRILRLLGSGGMGDVYLAEDARIEQRVAIKVIRAEASPYPNAEASQEAARLFQREARAIVKLDHPHILPLFDYGEERLGNMTIIYLVMPYRQEGSLADWLRRRSQVALLSPREVASIVSQAASALQHAHDRQIIHQDVKPSNFLLRHRPETPTFPDLLLADFGIARFSNATSSASLAIRGTPTSMAPEQWQGHTVPATDQYALAVMTYELLSGRPPFLGAPGPLMYQHLTAPPPPPSSIHPRLSGELDAVLLHALAKQPEQRFASVTAFANALQQAVQAMSEAEAPTRMATTPVPASQGDIRAVLAISAAEAHTGTTRTLTLPGGRKVKVPVPAGARDGQVVRMEGLGESSPEDGAVGALILTLLIRVGEERRSLSTASAVVAEDTALMAEQATPVTGEPVVSNTGQPPPVSKTILPEEVSTPPASSPEPTKPALPITPWFGQPGEVDQVGQAEWRGGAVPVEQPWQPPAAATVQPQRRISRRSVVVGLAALAVGGVAGGFFWLTRPQQPTIGTILYTYGGHSGYVWAAAWSPDGKRIASGSDDQTIRVWDAADGGNVYIYHGHSKAVTALAWSPDGKRIASGSDDQTVQVWDAVSGGNVYTYRGHSKSVTAVAWSPDSKHIVSGSADKTVQVWAADGGNAYAYPKYSAWLRAVAWSPDGKRIASGSDDKTVQVWDVASGSSVYTYRGHSRSVTAVAWSPDSSRIASGSADKTAQVWDAASGSNAYIYRGHSDSVEAVTWSPDGKRIASGCLDQTVQVWDVGGGGNVYTYSRHASGVYVVLWSPDGSRIASAGADETVQVWEAQ